MPLSHVAVVVATFHLVCTQTWPRQGVPRPQHRFLPGQRSQMPASHKPAQSRDAGSFYGQGQVASSGRLLQQPVNSDLRKGATVLPDMRVLPHILTPGQSHAFAVNTREGSNVTMIVFPCHGSITWNVTDPLGRIVKVHDVPQVTASPETNLRRRWQRQIPWPGSFMGFPTHLQRNPGARPSGSPAVPVEPETAAFGQSGTHEGEPAGLGLTIGSAVGSYFARGVSGGIFHLHVYNPTADDASFRIFSTIRASPYPKLPINPQLRVDGIRPASIILSWEGVQQDMPPFDRARGRLLKYCIEYKPIREVVNGDVHTSPCANQRSNNPTQPLCTTSTSLTLNNLSPNTEYVIDLTVTDLAHASFLPYKGVRVLTSVRGISLPNHQYAHFKSAPLSTQVYTLDVSPSGGGLVPLSISLFPCQGRVYWTLKRDGHLIDEYLPQYDVEIEVDEDFSEEESVDPESEEDDESVSPPQGLHAQSRRKRALRGAWRRTGRTVFTYENETALPGHYEISVTNPENASATYNIFATTTPSLSPFPSLPPNPNVVVRDVTNNQVTVEFGQSPSGNTSYCVSVTESPRQPNLFLQSVRNSPCSNEGQRAIEAGLNLGQGAGNNGVGIERPTNAFAEGIGGGTRSSPGLAHPGAGAGRNTDAAWPSQGFGGRPAIVGGTFGGPQRPDFGAPGTAIPPGNANPSLNFPMQGRPVTSPFGNPVQNGQFEGVPSPSLPPILANTPQRLPTPAAPPFGNQPQNPQINLGFPLGGGTPTAPINAGGNSRLGAGVGVPAPSAGAPVGGAPFGPSPTAPAAGYSIGPGLGGPPVPGAGGVHNAPGAGRSAGGRAGTNVGGQPGPRPGAGTFPDAPPALAGGPQPFPRNGINNPFAATAPMPVDPLFPAPPPPQCSPSTNREISNLQPGQPYLIQVMAVNTQTRQASAYTGAIVVPGKHTPSSSPKLSFSAGLLALTIFAGVFANY